MPKITRGFERLVLIGFAAAACQAGESGAGLGRSMSAVTETADGPCECPGGTDYLGNRVYSTTCGETICGADHTYYSCQPAGWQWDQGSCPPCWATGSCDTPCDCPGGTDYLGNPVSSTTCGDTVCGADHQVYACQPIGWYPIGMSCQLSCGCSGPDFAGAASDSTTCGAHICGPDYVDQVCQADRWTSTEGRCFFVDPELDLIVQYISREPELDYVVNAANPAMDGWPYVGRPIDWTAHVRNRGVGAVNTGFRWRLDGVELAGGRVTIPARGTATVVFEAAWSFARHELEFTLDPDGEISELEEANNTLTVTTDALAVGLWVEQSVYDFMEAHQRELAGAHSNSWEDWAQRQARKWNERFAGAISPDTPDGVLDRLRISAIHVVPDGALPLSRQPFARATNHPDLSDKSVDLMWGFPWTEDTAAYYGEADLEHARDYQAGLLHELGHARYLVDVYGFNVEPPAGRTDILQCGEPLFGSAYLPFSGGPVYTTHERGLMSGDYSRIDRYSAVALNRIAHHRALDGNYNAPANLGAFLRDLSADYRLTVRDATAGVALAGALVELFRATPVDDTPAAPGAYPKYFDADPDLVFTTDAAGAARIGPCPFTADPDCAVRHDIAHGSNTVILARVTQAGSVGYGFLEITDFNLEYWRGHTELGEVTLEVHMKGSCADVTGCSDGRRDGFLGYASIAACAGEWSGAPSLRTPRTGVDCGDDLGVACPVPADLCAIGWHICGTDGELRELRERMTGAACFADGGPGQFVAAVSHTVHNSEGDCSLAPDDVDGCFDTGWGSEPVCCGSGCFSGVCTSAVWPEQTHIGGGFHEGCNQLSSATATGVMCCRED